MQYAGGKSAAFAAAIVVLAWLCCSSRAYACGMFWLHSCSTHSTQHGMHGIRMRISLQYLYMTYAAGSQYVCTKHCNSRRLPSITGDVIHHAVQHTHRNCSNCLTASVCCVSSDRCCGAPASTSHSAVFCLISNSIHITVACCLLACCAVVWCLLCFRISHSTEPPTVYPAACLLCCCAGVCCRPWLVLLPHRRQHGLDRCPSG